MSSIDFCPSMNKPVYVCEHPSRYDPPRGWKKHSESLSLEERIEYALKEDDRDEFVNLVNSLTYEIEDTSLWTYMYSYDAVNCAAAILSGETSGKLEFEDTVSVVDPSDSSPLHQAAWFSAVNIIKLLLDRGESADIRLDCISLDYKVKDALPLSMALKSVWRRDSYLLVHGHEYCLFRLIVKLCLSRKRENLETIRVLARNTKELDHEFVKYMKDGGTRYLCALLMAGCRLLPASPLRSVNEFPGKEELLQVFHIFDTIGDVLSAYIRTERSEIVTEKKVASEIASLFRDAGLPVTSLDVSPSDYVPLPQKCKGVSSVDHLIRPCGCDRFPAFRLEKFAVPRPSFPQASSSFGYMSRGFSTHSALPFHSSTDRNTDTLRASSVDGKNLVNVVKNIKIGKRYGFLATALRRVGRFS